jgi:hypothetical protein
MLFLLLVSSFFVSPRTAEAGNERWKAIAGKNGEERILYDPESVMSLRPGVVRVWVMGFDNDHSPKKTLEEIDCSNKIVRDIEVIMEKPNKPTLHTITPSDWRGIVRESPRGELFKILCR